jgi:hypothetical protein
VCSVCVCVYVCVRIRLHIAKNQEGSLVIIDGQHRLGACSYLETKMCVCVCVFLCVSESGKVREVTVVTVEVWKGAGSDCGDCGGVERCGK